MGEEHDQGERDEGAERMHVVHAPELDSSPERVPGRQLFDQRGGHGEPEEGKPRQAEQAQAEAEEQHRQDDEDTEPERGRERSSTGAVLRDDETTAHEGRRGHDEVGDADPCERRMPSDLVRAQRERRGAEPEGQ